VHPMLPIRTALTGCLAHPGVIGSGVLPAVGCSLVGSALPGIESSGLWVSGSLLGTMASADFPRHFLRGTSPGKNALLPRATAAFTSAPKPEDFAVWCQLVPARRPSMRFLFIGSRVPSSLPPPGRLPFRSWPRVVVSSCFHVWFSYRGLAPHLQRAHAGRTPRDRGEPPEKRSFRAGAGGCSRPAWCRGIGQAVTSAVTSRPDED